MNLNRHQRQMLIELVEAGHGMLDRSGRVCVGPIKRALPGDAIAWLVLIGQGLAAGERGLIIPTEEGRAAVTGETKAEA